MGGVNGEVDSPHRRQGFSASPQTPWHVRRKANNRTISLRDQQDRRTEWPSHVLPAKELAGRNASDIARPLSKCRLQNLEDAGLVIRLEGPDLDPAVGGYGTRWHRERTIDQRWGVMIIPTKLLAVASLAQSDTLDLTAAHTRFSSWMSHKPRSARRRRDAGAATEPIRCRFRDVRRRLGWGSPDAWNGRGPSAQSALVPAVAMPE